MCACEVISDKKKGVILVLYEECIDIYICG